MVYNRRNPDPRLVESDFPLRLLHLQQQRSSSCVILYPSERIWQYERHGLKTYQMDAWNPPHRVWKRYPSSNRLRGPSSRPFHGTPCYTQRSCRCTDYWAVRPSYNLRSQHPPYNLRPQQFPESGRPLLHSQPRLQEQYQRQMTNRMGA